MAQEGGPPPGAMRAGWKGSVVAVLAIVVAVIAFLAGFFAGGVFLAPGGPALIRVGTNTPFPPFEFRDDQEAIIGFDLDLVTEVLLRMGFERDADWVIFDFRDFSGGLLPAVVAGRVDIGLGPTTITEPRKATLDFSDPFFESDQGVLVRANDNRDWCVDDNNCQGSDIDAAGGPNYEVGVQTGTTSDCWVTLECWEEDNLANVADADIQRFASVEAVLTALDTGAVDIVVIDAPAADGIAAAQPTKFKVGGTIQTDELYGFALTKGDPRGLLARINAALAAMKADGKYETICRAWFGAPCPLPAS